MKVLMTIAAAALACAAWAEGTAPAKRSAPVRARPDMMRMQEGGFDPVTRAVTNPRLAEKIGLTAEQREKVQEIEKAQREASKALREKLRTAMKNQADLMKAEPIDEGAVMGAIDELFEVRKAMAKSQTKRVISIKALLTPEQVKAALEEVSKPRPSAQRKPPRGLKPVPEAKPDAEAKPADVTPVESKPVDVKPEAETKATPKS